MVLLNSDTVVSPEWIDRLVACAESDPRIGVVGPLSNTASWQSIPELSADGDWAENPLEEGISPGGHGPHGGPVLGSCLPQAAVLERLLLDDSPSRSWTRSGCSTRRTFGRGYGEENDYCLRAVKANWQLAVADDVYVYHRQSRSYSNERRKALCEQANGRAFDEARQPSSSMRASHLPREPHARGNPRRARYLAGREALIAEGRRVGMASACCSSCPSSGPGGGANVVIQEAEVMRRMGVDVQFFNFHAHRTTFESSYPGLKIPVIYGERRTNCSTSASNFDVFVATIFFSVRLLAPLQDLDRPPVLGYYVQDYEPYFVRPRHHRVPRGADFVHTDPGHGPLHQDGVESQRGQACRRAWIAMSSARA